MSNLPKRKGGSMSAAPCSKIFSTQRIFKPPKWGIEEEAYLSATPPAIGEIGLKIRIAWL
jgi:hypothetical protein